MNDIEGRVELQRDFGILTAEFIFTRGQKSHSWYEQDDPDEFEINNVKHESNKKSYDISNISDEHTDLLIQQIIDNEI